MPDDSTAAEAKGRIEEAVGWATGDRRVEAEGRATREEGSEPSDPEVESVEDEVRADHGDV